MGECVPHACMSDHGNVVISERVVATHSGVLRRYEMDFWLHRDDHAEPHVIVVEDEWSSV